MIFTVRKADICDALGICRLSRDEMGYDYPLEKTKERLKSTLVKDYEAVFVAVDDEREVLGYIHASDYELLFSEKRVNILGIAVKADCVRQGIGGALMNAVEEWAKARRAKAIRLVSGEKRAIAHSFYEKCGFVCEKSQKNFKKNI